MNQYKTAILAFRLGQMLKVYDVYGWPELTGEGVSSAYQTLELYDDWILNTTNTVSGRKIGRARTVQLQESSVTGVWELWIFDAQMFTGINFAAGNNSVAIGDVLKGRTSGAKGYVGDAGSGTHCWLEQVSGAFLNGEVIERDGRVVGTLEAAHTYNLTDTRSRILDTDYALELAELARLQIIQQAGNAMLAQANAEPQQVLALLQ